MSWQAGPSEEVLLSILVPAYEYAEGIRRILDTLGALPVSGHRLEILVFDDSSSSDVSDAVAASPLFSRVLYRKNVPPLGACENWNALVKAARGDFCLLLHHDECPASPQTIELIVQTIEAMRAGHKSDVLSMDCIVVSPDGSSHLHSPGWLRYFICRWVPSYLWRRNLIGPVSTMVVRRVAYPPFDPLLKWLIDVDMYVTLLTRSRDVRILKSAVISRSRTGGSITASLGDTGAIEKRELAYLTRKFRTEKLLRWLSRRPLAVMPLLGLDAIAWGCVTVWLRVLGRICSPLRRTSERKVFGCSGRH